MEIFSKKQLFLLAMILPLLSNTPAWADHSVVPGHNKQVVKVESKQFDQRAQILQIYLAHFDSPLQYHAQDFIDAADTYQLDWKLVPAVAGVESTFGKAIPGGYNAWGWGVYGTQAMYFKSWRDGIFTVSEGLRKNYFDRGLTEPFSINRAYATSPFWGYKVSYFLTDIDNFSKQYGVQKLPKEATVLKVVPAFALRPAIRADIVTERVNLYPQAEGLGLNP